MACQIKAWCPWENIHTGKSKLINVDITQFKLKVKNLRDQFHELKIFPSP